MSLKFGGFVKFQDLEVWKQSHELTLMVYDITGKFDKEERYSLTQQMRRAAYSVPMNIAEGKASASSKTYVRHLHISRGSNAELQYQLILSKDLGYIDANQFDHLYQRTNCINRMLNSMISKLRTME